MFGHFSSARMSPLSALGFFLAILAFLLMTGAKPGHAYKKYFRSPIPGLICAQ